MSISTFFARPSQPGTAGSAFSRGALRLDRRAARPSERRDAERGSPGASVSTASFRGDPLNPRVERAVAAMLAKGKVVTPVDVLVEMNLLAP